MRPVLARRVAGFATSIFTEMTALAVQHRAVNLGQGFPDFAAPEFVKRAATDAIAADMNQYAPSPGLPRLRQAIANQWQREHGHEPDWQHEVTITSGATEALAAAALALCNPGDRVIVFEPAYDAYVPDLIMAGAEPVFVRLHPGSWELGAGVTEPAPEPQPQAPSPSSWWFDPDELRAAFASGPRAIMLNTPHNPTGKVFTRAELELIAALCQQYDVLAISDEVYDRMVFGGAAHLSLATLPGMWQRTLTINSIGKTFSVTGWKVGYAVGPAPLSHALRQAHQWITFATATPFQQASALAIEQSLERSYYAQLQREYDERRALLCALLEQAGLPVLPVEGSYFVSADISGLGVDAGSFCRRLTIERGVAAIPLTAFYAEPHGAPQLVRFCFAKQLATLRLAGERLNAH
ncbi:MAG: aminotransferase class I/II-fold pyridoxal phosphate-dependent enzyme [Chloroflexales bacterium]|nr:aminotransferase class I/II-fold pyridoxal phosphate-dependent enzyme [Chloroflexales bacterium]